jgi:hypothetical protein
MERGKTRMNLWTYTGGYNEVINLNRLPSCLLRLGVEYSNSIEHLNSSKFYSLLIRNHGLGASG